jgi:adenosylcobinamide-GDP ribazoletransferase
MVALSFLTVCPAVRGRAPTQREISNSRAWYPVAGLLLGLLLVGVQAGASVVFPAYLTAALLVAFLVAVTRGLHLDGFMDVCDGLFGGYTPERRLDIMRDSHVGSFAVAGAATLLLLKYGALLSLLVSPQGGALVALLLFPMLSRWGMVVALGAFPYVRREGLGSPFHEGSARWATLLAATVAVAAVVLLGGIGGAAMLAGVSALAWCLGWAMSRMLGGLTGDTYGAINELAEVAILMAAVAMLPYSWLGPVFWAERF